MRLRRKYRTLGLAGLMALVAMLAVSAVGASSAMAEHLEIGKCVEKAGAGSWEDSNCTKALVEGNFAWETYAEAVAKGAKTSFTSSGGEKILKIEGAPESEWIKCATATNAGKLTGATTDEVTITFHKCKTFFGLVACSSGTEPSETIKTEKLTSNLVWVKRTTAPLVVGLDLKPPAGKNFTEEIKCSSVKILVRGSVIGVITPINTMSTTFKLAFEVESGKQKPSEYEETNGTKVTDTLECSTNGGTSWKPCTEQEITADTITLEEPWEIWASYP